MRNSKSTPQFRIPGIFGAHHIFWGFTCFFLCVLCSPFHLYAQDSSQSGLLSLEDCIEIALASSPDVTAARERIEQARASVRQAQSGFYPNLSIRETFTRSDFAPMTFSNQLAQGNLTGEFPSPPPVGFDPFSQFNEPDPISNWNTQFLLQLPLFRGGQTYYGSRAAMARLKASELALKAVHSNLAFSVSRAYFEILKTENSIRIAEQAVNLLKEHLDIANARYENEVALRSDILRISVSLAEAEETLEIARNNLDRARSRLNLALGRPISAELRLHQSDPPPRHNAATTETMDELTTTARRLRPEIESLNENIDALRDSANSARGGHYPQINAFAHYDIDTEDFSGSGESWTIGVGASISIFDGFLTRANVRQGRARLREAEAQSRQLMLQIELEVKDAYLAKAEATRRMDVQRGSSEEAEETLRIVSERYAEGLALVTELLDSEVALTNTRLRLLSAEYDYLVAAASLERAVGRIIEEGTEQ